MVIRLVTFAFAVLLLNTAANAQDTVGMSLSKARSLAVDALSANDSRLALDIALAIIAQVPNDRDALAIVAAAAPQQGDPRAGRIAGARAFALSRSSGERYEAARLTALAAANERRFTLGTFWLRRALIAASTDEQRAQTLADARLLQRQSPWSFSFTASLTPSSNLNGGAASNVASAPGNPVGTLSDDALALAGWRATLALGATYRLQENATSRTLIGTQYQAARVWITENVDIPDEALSTNVTEISLRHDRALDRSNVSGQLSYAYVNFRDLDPFDLRVDTQKYDIWRVDFDWRFPLDESVEWTISAGHSWTEYDNVGIGQVTRHTLGSSLAFLLPNDDLARATLRYGSSEGDNTNYTVTDWTAQMTYAIAEPSGPLAFNMTGGVTWSDYPSYRLLLPVEGGRQDTSVFATLNIGFPQVTYAGFTPVLAIHATTTDSNVSRFTRDTISAGLSIASQF